MIVFVSPTKNMKQRKLELPLQLPQFCVEASEILDALLQMNDEKIMEVMKVSDRLALQTQEKYQKMKFDKNGSHAITSYDGLVFKHMCVDLWSQEDLLFANRYLRILSAFYGVVEPFDSIYPYRLEMQAQNVSEDILDLYSYWNDKLMQELRSINSDGVYVDLASKEYSKCIYPYLKKEERCVEIVFLVHKNNAYKIITTQAKMARGKMVRFIVQNQIQDVEELKTFMEDNWHFNDAMSNENKYVFIKES